MTQQGRPEIASSKIKQQKIVVLIWVPGVQSWNQGLGMSRFQSHGFSRLRFLELAMWGLSSSSRNLATFQKGTLE
jgi:hypothetical protein